MAKEVAMRKRQQIQKANRTMFFWIAGASALLGLTAVLSIFLFQQIQFNTKVINEKMNTASTLNHNNKIKEDLKNNINALRADDKLNKVKLTEEADALEAVLDALPATANSAAFGSSLQYKLLNDDRLTIESLKVAPVEGVESNDASQSAISDSASIGSNSIQFSFTVATTNENVNALKDALTKIENSIRPVDIIGITFEASGARTSMNVVGVTYYEPAKTVDLKDKKVKL